MKKLTLISLLFVLFCASISARAASGMQITVDGTQVELDSPAVIQDGRTLLPIRSIADAMGLSVVWLGEEQTASLWSADTMVRVKIDSNAMDVNGKIVEIDTAPAILYDRTYMPVRAILEAFGAEVIWADGNLDIYYATAVDTNLTEQTVTAAAEETPKAQEPETTEPPVVYTANASGRFFFSQPQNDWGFENGGRGYCWVCSYAMLISNVKGEAVTPADVAAFNMEEGGSGAYMRSHGGIVERFGVEFVAALDESSPYFAKYEDWRGSTYLNITSDEDVIAALKEALDRNPRGVIVRYNGYPHSMLAVGYEGDTIYYDEPAYADGEWIPFEETCLKNYNLSDITFIQAIA